MSDHSSTSNNGSHHHHGNAAAATAARGSGRKYHLSRLAMGTVRAKAVARTYSVCVVGFAQKVTANKTAVNEGIVLDLVVV